MMKIFIIIIKLNIKKILIYNDVNLSLEDVDE